MTTSASKPSLLLSLVPIAALVALLAGSVALFGDGNSGGPNQIALVLAAVIAAAIGVSLGHTWKDLEAGIVHGISLSMGAILILLVVGALIGSWILAGVVPTMIYYGLQLLTPSIFYPSACVICCLVSVSTGSSWTTAGTVGVALIGIAAAQNLNLGLAAGAIVSGAYFGDKLSPLSDTTNLAPAMAGTDLFTHIRHMLWTTVPSLIIALILFTVLGMTNAAPQDTAAVQSILDAIQQNFAIGPHLLLPAVLVIVMVIRKTPATPALIIGALTGCLFAVIFQPAAVTRLADAGDMPAWAALIKGCWQALASGFSLSSGNEALDDLLSRGGMGSMLNTVWLILSAMTFGAVMEKTGMLARIAETILGAVKGTGSLVASTLATSIGMNVLASDQYIAIVIPGRMFRAEFARRGLAPQNLSRCLEDAGTMTSSLVPWNTCGAFMAQTLGVATLTYAPYAFLNLLNPIISAIYGFTGFSIVKLDAASESPERV
jgi:NhaC family Na+:H+ antiporter